MQMSKGQSTEKFKNFELLFNFSDNLLSAILAITLPNCTDAVAQLQTLCTCLLLYLGK